MSEEQIYSISLEHRPCRVAFFLDPDNVGPRLLDAIVDFCVEHWGGRYNPIVPIKDGALYPAYKKLLEVADPDVIYCFSKLNDETLEYIDWSIGPMAMEQHPQSPGQENQALHIRTDHQTSISGMLVGLRELFPPVFRKPEPSVLAFNYDKGEQTQASRFTRWNFGLSWSAYVCHRDSGVLATFPPVPASDQEVLRTVAATRNLVPPIVLARNAPVHRLLTKVNRRGDFTVCYGSSPWNLVQYWNDAFFRAPGPLWGGIHQIWLPESIPEDPETFREFIQLIRLKVYVQGSSGGMEILSYDHTAEELNDLAERIRVDSHGHLHRSTVAKLEPGAFDTGEPQIPTTFFRKPALMRAGKGRSIFIEPGKPPAIKPDGQDAWMVDLRIENPYQEKPYLNSEPWWKLPRRTWVAQTFAGVRPSRVAADGRLSLRIDARSEGLGFKIPEAPDIFASLLLPDSFYHAARDQRHGQPHSSLGECLRVSDKGKYLNGVVSLFSTLREASYFFENPFWRSILEELCCPSISTQAHAKISHDIRDRLPALEQQIQAEPDSVNSWLSDLIFTAARRIPIADDPITFSAIQKKYETYLVGLPDEWSRSQRLDLRGEMSELTKSRVLFQGTEVRCKHCLSKFWYHVDDLRNELTCKGCRNEIPLPAESEWAYQPNELLRSAMAHLGVIPVIRVLGRLARTARECFLWSAGVEYFDYKDDGIVSQGEIDLCWLLDGQFGLAEIKSSVDGFGAADVDRLVKIASIVRPHSILLAAVDGEDDRLNRLGTRIGDRVAALNIEVHYIKPSHFKVTPIEAR